MSSANAPPVKPIDIDRDIQLDLYGEGAGEFLASLDLPMNTDEASLFQDLDDFDPAAPAPQVDSTLDSLRSGSNPSQALVSQYTATSLDGGIARGKPLGEQSGFQRLSPTYFADIANVDDATDDVPTWDVRPEAEQAPLLRRAFIDEVDDVNDDPTEASLWWMPVVDDVRKNRPQTLHDVDMLTDDTAFCVEHTDEAALMADSMDPQAATFARTILPKTRSAPPTAGTTAGRPSLTMLIAALVTMVVAAGGVAVAVHWLITPA